MEVHTIGMEVQQKSVEGRLGGKVNRCGQPYDTYNYGPHSSKTEQRRVQQWIQDI